MFKHALKLSFYNFLSRITGFLREVLFARAFGISIYADAFILAFKIPNLFRSIFAEGAASNAMLPVLKNAEEKGVMNIFLLYVTFILFTTSFVISSLLAVFPKSIVKLFAAGFNEEITVLASKILTLTSWFLLAMTMVFIYNNLLNFRKRYGFAALIQILVNLSLSAVLLLSPEDMHQGIMRFSTAVFMISIGIIAICAFKLSSHISLSKCFPANELRQFVNFFLTGVLISSSYQILVFISTFTASFFEPGSVAVLNYADRIYQIPFGVIGVSLSQVVLSYMVAMEDKLRLLKKSLYISSRLGFFFAGLIISIAYSLFELVFLNSSITSDTSEWVSVTLRCLCYGLPFAMMSLVNTRYLYSQGRHKENLVAIWLQVLFLGFTLISTFMIKIPIISLKEIFPDLKYDSAYLALALSLSGIFHWFITGVQALGFWSFKSFTLDLFWPIFSASIGFLSVISVDLSDLNIIYKLILQTIIYSFSFGMIFFVEVIGRKF